MSEDYEVISALKNIRREARAAIKKGSDPFAVYQHLRKIEQIADENIPRREKG